MLIKALQLKPLYAPDGDGDDPAPVVAAVPTETEDELELGDPEPIDPPEDEEETEQEEQPVLAAPKPKRNEPSERIRQLNDDRKREAERADRLERELREYQAERARERAEREAATEEDRLALMTTEERVDYKLRKATEVHQRQLAQQQFQSADQLDRLEFRTKLPERYARFADEVETTLQKIRNENKINVPRETVLKLVLGEKLLAQAGKPAPKRPAPAGRTPPPSQGRGDMQGDRRKVASLEKRLENVAL